MFKRLSGRPVIQSLENRKLFSANLLTNANFSHGYSGFTTTLSKGTTSLVYAGTSVVGTNPHLYHYAGASFGDHTTGTGKMLLVNGSPNPAAMTWRETVRVVPGVAYTFSGWAASWATAVDQPGLGDVSPAQVQINIDGAVLSTTTLPAADGEWTALTGTWLATSPRATITIFDLNTDASGNDSAYDDFAFTPLASIHGSVVTDVPNTAKPGRHLAPAAGVTVYLDADNNGLLDPLDQIAVTNKLGRYTFTGLLPGTYKVIQENPPAGTIPPAPLSINLPAGKQVSHKNLWDIYTATESVSVLG